MEQANNIIPLRRSGERQPGQFWNFTHPHQVVTDPALRADDKRAILSAWASDIHAVESMPVLRHMPGTPFAVTVSSIMDALAKIDRLSDDEDDHPPRSPKGARQSGSGWPSINAA